MDFYTKWAFSKAITPNEKITLAKLLDVCDENFYVPRDAFAEQLKDGLYVCIRNLEKKGFISVKRSNGAPSRQGNSILGVTVLYEENR